MNEIWLHLQAFLEILSTRNVLIEIGVLAMCCCSAAWWDWS